MIALVYAACEIVTGLSVVDTVDHAGGISVELDLAGDKDFHVATVVGETSSVGLVVSGTAD